MRRIIAFVFLCAFVLSACGGGTAAEVTVADPPKAAAFEKSDNPKVNAIIDGWRAEAPAEMISKQIKQETIEQKVYQSTASLQEVADFYAQLLNNGWTEVRNMPGVQNNVFLKGYDHGNVSLVVGAFDAKEVGGQGVIIYTAKGNK